MMKRKKQRWTQPTEAIELLNHYKEIIRNQQKRVIQYIFKQGEIFKKIQDTENFFNGSGQIRSNIFLKTAVYKTL